MEIWSIPFLVTIYVLLFKPHHSAKKQKLTNESRHQRLPPGLQMQAHIKHSAKHFMLTKTSGH